MKDYTGVNKPPLKNKAPRSARRARKPLQENWIKGPGRGIWLKCTYAKCSFEWQYFGGHQWAECPVCHSMMKVAVAKRNFLIQNKDDVRPRRESKDEKRREGAGGGRARGPQSRKWDDSLARSLRNKK